MTERPPNARAARACPKLALSKVEGRSRRACPELALSKVEGRSRRILILSLIILAFALRVYQLDAKSIWFDESHSLNRASLDLPSIASGKQIWGDRVIWDRTHVPFYFFLLHFLIKLAGNSDFTLRFLSVIFGVLTMPLIYVMGKKLGHPHAGLWAALLATFSPFYLWYSQEARMYTLLVFLGLLSVYL